MVNIFWMIFLIRNNIPAADPKATYYWNGRNGNPDSVEAKAGPRQKQCRKRAKAVAGCAGKRGRYGSAGALERAWGNPFKVHEGLAEGENEEVVSAQKDQARIRKEHRKDAASHCKKEQWNR